VKASRSPLRIAYVASRLDPGGAEGQMLALAERLPRDEFRVDFICTSERGAYVPRALAAGARVFSLGESPPERGSPFGLAWHRARKIGRYVSLIRRNRYDILDAWMYPAYDIAALSRPFTGVPVVIAGRRGIGEPETQYGFVERAAAAFARRLCDVTVANSRVAAAKAIDHEHLDPRRVRVIYNGVERVDSPPPGQRDLVRAAWGATPDDVIIGCVANYRPVKALDLLIAAFADVMRANPNVWLVLVGEGPERPRLERLVESGGLSSRVVLHGREPEARKLNPAFDVVALTSSSEGLPNAILEAEAAGRPVVATDVGGMREVVVDRVTGLLVPSGDSPALVRALVRLAADQALRERMGRAGRLHVESAFGMDRFVREFADLYRELSGRASRRA
jgi:glycosyltransferase involved in cell wall biosynthesis